MGNKLSYPEEDLSGKVAIVTGGNAGIGYETAKALARLGAHTFIACRSKERAEAAIDCMKAELNPEASKQESEEGKKEEVGETGGEGQAGEVEGEGAAEAQTGSEGQQDKETGGEEAIKLEYIPLDLSSFQSTIDCVRVFKERNLPLHILINNAAVAWVPFKLTEDGFEEQFQVNALGPMLLTLELLPLLLATPGDRRILFVSSKASYRAPPFSAEKLVVSEAADHDRLRSYSSTKMYDIMAGFALQRRLEDTGITVSSPEPGYVKSGLAQGFQDKSFFTFLNKIGYAVIARSPVEGAQTILNCALNPELNTEICYFYSDCKVATPIPQASVENNQELLWEKVIGILKDHLSAEVLEKYGEAFVQPPPADTPPADQPPMEGEPAPDPPREDTSEPPEEDSPADPPIEQ